MLTPAVILAVLVALTGIAYAVERVRLRQSQGVLRELATEWGMNFGPEDTLLLTPKVARYFPIPGAANLRLVNVIYGVERDRYHYVFTAEYTLGVIRGRRRAQRVGAFSESRHRERGEPPTAVVLAPLELPMIEQYRQLSPRN